jgi:hypothetical protein
MRPLPTPAEVATFMDWPDDPDSLTKIAAHLTTVTAFVRSYVRRRGFLVVLVQGQGMGEQCEDDIAAVIVSATARSVNNPTQLVRAEIGEWNETPSAFNGYTLAEQHVLHGYRRRTA